MMFCYQCEQTSQGEGCQTIGVCGKDETTATLQDLLIHAVKGISMYAYRARQQGASDPEIDAFTIQAIFATMTNVNFDPVRLVGLIAQAVSTRDAARDLYERAASGRALCRSSWVVRLHGFLLQRWMDYSHRASRFFFPRGF